MAEVLFIAIAVVFYLVFVLAIRQPLKGNPVGFLPRCKEAALSGMLYLGELLNGRPFYESEDVFKALVICGSTGSGKTSWTLGHLLLQIRTSHPDAVIVFEDGKGLSSEVCRWMLEIDGPEHFSYFSTEIDDASHALPLPRLIQETAGNETDFADRFLLSLGISRGLHEEHSYFYDICHDTILAIRQHYPETHTFTEWYNASKQRHIYETQDHYQHSSRLRAQLRAYAHIGSLNVPPGGAREIDFKKMFIQGGCSFYGRFKSNPEIASMIARLVRDQASAVNSGRAAQREVFLIMDEFWRFCDKSLMEELNSLARAIRLRPIYILQKLSQLVDADHGGDGFVKSILDLPFLFYGCSDGGYTPQILIDEWQLEVHETHEDGTSSYHQEPLLPYDTIRSLCVDSKSQGQFLARIPRGKVHPGYTLAKLNYAMTLEHYEALLDAGFFKEGELPQSVFSKRTMNAPKEPEVQVDPALAEQVRKAFQLVSNPQGGSNGRSLEPTRAGQDRRQSSKGPGHKGPRSPRGRVQGA